MSIVFDPLSANFLRSRLTLDVRISYPFTFNALQDELPLGWQEKDWLPMIQEFDDRFRGFQLTKMTIEKGLLRFYGDGDPLHLRMFDGIVQKIARESSNVCMKCGVIGYRRKNEEGTPCLCAADYVWYINELDKQNLL
jgi:hypothetical protein